MYEGRAPQSAPPLELSAEFVSMYVQGWAGAYLTWVVATLIFDRWLVAQNNSYGPAHLGSGSSKGARPFPATPEAQLLGEPVTPARPSPAFLDRLPRNVGRNILAIEAEDHYVRIHTDQGNTLISGRFSEIVAAVHPLDGVRVHRSYWVQRSSVTSVKTQGRGLELTLSNGLKVPVSHAYKEVARQAGWGLECGASPR
jgi:hypothetical protein